MVFAYKNNGNIKERKIAGVFLIFQTRTNKGFAVKFYYFCLTYCFADI